jgi:uncharacterized BrkB/YihY/UPF0761 family membrane protein
MDIIWVIGVAVALLVTVVLAIVVSNFLNTVFKSDEDWYDLDFSDDE